MARKAWPVYAVDVTGESAFPPNNFTHGVWGDSKTGNGVAGTSDSGWAGVFGYGGSYGGVFGVSGTGPSSIGVQGNSNVGTGVVAHSDYGYGMRADSANYAVDAAGGNIGVHARNTTVGGNDAYLGTRGLAGDFFGNVYVHGYLTKAGGGFLIDHPLDPANKYLAHSFVESPDRKNVYDGVVVLDTAGEARVELPSWFDTLNRDFRYQLTCVGQHAPVYISQEIEQNAFRIAGGSPGLKVSWQVTGIRQDAWANANPLAPEELKPETERGTFLHPSLHGAPPRRESSTRATRRTRKTTIKKHCARWSLGWRRPSAPRTFLNRIGRGAL